MKRIALHILAALVGLLIPLSARAETVSRKEASLIAEKFFNALAGQVMAKPKLVYNGKRLTTDRLFTPFYLYNHPAGGSVIIAADNKAMPILGYSRKSNFSTDHAPEEISRLLTDYAREIELIRYDSRLPSEAIEAWGDIPASIDYTLNRYYGDDSYLRIENHSDGTENDADVWIMRRHAIEFPEIARPPQEEEPGEEEYIPFAFYDGFIAETRADVQRRLDMFDEKLSPTQPRLRWIGGGHFEVSMPEPIRMVSIYNMDGAMIRRLTFRDADIATFNLDGEPRGFYFALVTDVNGLTQGFKLYK